MRKGLMADLLLEPFGSVKSSLAVFEVRERSGNQLTESRGSPLEAHSSDNHSCSLHTCCDLIQ